MKDVSNQKGDGKVKTAPCIIYTLGIGMACKNTLVIYNSCQKHLTVSLSHTLVLSYIHLVQNYYLVITCAIISTSLQRKRYLQKKQTYTCNLNTPIIK